MIAWGRLGIPVTLVNVGGFISFMLFSSLVAYSLFLMPQILSFWFMNTSAIAEISDLFWDFNSMPMDIYNNWIKQIGIFVVPIFVITNFPPLFLLHKMPPLYQLWVLLVPLLLFMLVRLLWKQGLKSFNSASS